ncbi:MAG: porin [Myxococcota bacterium]
MAKTPTAGFASGHFFIQSADGRFRLTPSLRLQIDAYSYRPQFEALGQPRDQIFLRRARPELFGTLFGGDVQFTLAGDFADAPNGVNATDIFLIFNVNPMLRIQIGQFDLPFSFENRTSDRYIEFMERSFVVRNLGTANKEAGVMVFGATPKDHLHYAAGLFSGSGINVDDVDNNFDFVARAFYRPWATSTVFDRVQIGSSISIGERTRANQAYLGGSLPPGQGWLTTQSGYSWFLNPYAGSDGQDTRLAVTQDGTTLRVGGELSVPIGPFAFRSEYIYVRTDTSENLLDTGVMLRDGGLLEAHGFYTLLSFWLFGDPRILPDAGVQGAPIFDATGNVPQSDFHLQISARFDWVRADYDPGTTLGTSLLGPSLVGGDYTFWDIALGVNLWWTRHIRFTANYVYNKIDGRVVNFPSPDQDFIHEIGLRAALAL